MSNLFEIAVRRKYRFPLNGQLSVEELWDLYPESLDKIYKTLNAKKKQADEESLLSVKTKENEDLVYKIEIVRYIYETKKAEKEARDQEKVRKEQKQKILALIDEKKNEDMKNLSLEQLEALLKGMEE